MARKLKTTIFIACEGKNTEPNYFERIKEEVEDENQLSITIYPDKSEKTGHRSDGIGLVKEAQNRAEEFDELYVVLDKDGYTLHDAVLELAAQPVHGKTVRICLSSISFEHWILLHYEQNNIAFKKSADVIAYLDSQKYYPGYTKTSDRDVYTAIKEQTLVGISNAAWLRSYQQRTNGVLAAHHYDAYTDVDVLVKRLLCDHTRMHWYRLDDRISINKLEITVRLTKDGLSICIVNHQTTRFVLNQANIAYHFLAYDENETAIVFPEIDTISIHPDEEVALSIPLPIFHSAKCRLEIRFAEEKAIVFLHDDCFRAMNLED